MKCQCDEAGCRCTVDACRLPAQRWDCDLCVLFGRLPLAGDDIRPSWPIEQLVRLVPNGNFRSVPQADHNYWKSDPELWLSVCTAACQRIAYGQSDDWRPNSPGKPIRRWVQV